MSGRVASQDDVVVAVTTVPHVQAGAPVESAGLSPREAEVLRQVAQGRSNSAIAEAIHMSADTVKRDLARVGEQLGAGSNRFDIVREALRQGVITSANHELLAGHRRGGGTQPPGPVVSFHDADAPVRGTRRHRITDGLGLDPFVQYNTHPSGGGQQWGSPDFDQPTPPAGPASDGAFGAATSDAASEVTIGTLAIAANAEPDQVRRDASSLIDAIFDQVYGIWDPVRFPIAATRSTLS